MRIYRIGFMAILVLGVSSATNAEEKFSFNFRDYKLGNPDFKLLNNPSKSLCTVDEKGLMIVIPKGRTEPMIAGLATNFAIQGDFEVTLRYDSLAPELPPAKYGTGVSMWMSLNADTVVGATMGRTQRPDGTFFVANRVYPDDKGKEKYEPVSVPAPADQNSGRLRLARTGKTIRHSVSVGDSDDFKEIRVWDIGSEDVGLIRFQGSPNGLEYGVKVRLIDLQVRADTILRGGRRESSKSTVPPAPTPTPDGAVPSAPEEKPRSKLWLWIAVIGAGLLIGAVVLLTLRKRRG